MVEWWTIKLYCSIFDNILPLQHPKHWSSVLHIKMSDGYGIETLVQGGHRYLYYRQVYLDRYMVYKFINKKFKKNSIII